MKNRLLMAPVSCIILLSTSLAAMDNEGLSKTTAPILHLHDPITCMEPTCTDTSCMSKAASMMPQHDPITCMEPTCTDTSCMSKAASMAPQHDPISCMDPTCTDATCMSKN